MSQKQEKKKVLIMTEDQWKKNKAWIMQLPGAVCMPIIEQFERYLHDLPVPPVEEKKEK
jgi:hypothetical protein